MLGIKNIYGYIYSYHSHGFLLLTNRRRRKYLKNQISSFKTDTPVVVVGNINIGGTGKTPLVKYIASKLREGFKGWNCFKRLWR